MIWFTSDHHFNHENIIRHDNRPFSSLQEMTIALVDYWNELVQPNDVVWHLGDFALSWGKKHATMIDALLASLHGEKHLIVGNHDRKEVTKNTRWASVSPYHEIKASAFHPKIVLCHYAIRSWNGAHHGSWMLHGHSHGNLPDMGGKSLDVGVMCHHYRPISLEQVAAFMEHRDFKPVDHHTKEEA